MHEVVEEQEISHLEDGIPLKNISMFFKRNSSNDPRRYNIPKIGEIAVNFDSENGEPHMEDFMIQPKIRNNEFITTKLSYLSQNADPMVYPLIFFHGEPGWRPGIEHTTIKPYDMLINSYFTCINNELFYLIKKCETLFNDNASILFCQTCLSTIGKRFQSIIILWQAVAPVYL